MKKIIKFLCSGSVKLTNIGEFGYCGTHQSTNSVRPSDIRNSRLLKKPIISNNEMHLQIARMARKLNDSDDLSEML